MGGDGIYRKTEKGRTEIATRANKLGMRERTMLIIVDDKTTRAGLLSKSGHAAGGDVLDALLAQGFIETDSAAGTVSANATPAATAAAAHPAATTSEAQVEVSLTSASRFACRALVTFLGPSADDLTAMVEKANGATELATVLEKCRNIIQSLAGKQKAEKFWSEVSARLPRP